MLGVAGGLFNEGSFTYDGNYTYIEDANGFRIEFLTSGTLHILKGTLVDAFIVGGGGSGGKGKGDGSSSGGGGGGGGGGYTLTVPRIYLSAGQDITVVVGAGGVNTYTDSTHRSGYPSFFGIYFADGGEAGENSGDRGGGRGGSGGGGGAVYGKSGKGNGGSAGNNGAAATDGGGGGYGQKDSHNTTAIKTKYGQLPTREFYLIDEDASATAYAKGGNGGTGNTGANGTAGTANTGNGGNGASVNHTTSNRNGGKGGSGIVIIRKAKPTNGVQIL